MVALVEGANPDRLLKLIKQIYPKNQRLAFYLELSSKMNPDLIKTVYYTLKLKGKLEPTDVINILLIGTSKTSDQLQKEIINTFKTYPEEYELFKKRLDKILESLDKLKEMT